MNPQSTGMDKTKLMKKADQIWKMLDDMAVEDPAAYKKFIDQQMKAGKEVMKPPEPHMCVHTMLMVSALCRPVIIVRDWREALDLCFTIFYYMPSKQRPVILHVL